MPMPNDHSIILFLSQFIAVVPQSYSVNVMDEHVLRGNTGILKCHIPSFVADFVFVSAWIENDNTEIYAEQGGFGGNDLGISNIYPCQINFNSIYYYITSGRFT